MKPKSGVFVAVSIALGRTGVYVGNYGEVTDSTASVVSTGGTVRAEADSLIRNRTYAISSPISVYVDEYGNPTFTQQPTQKQSLRSMVSLTESVKSLVCKAISPERLRLPGNRQRRSHNLHKYPD